MKRLVVKASLATTFSFLALSFLSSPNLVMYAEEHPNVSHASWGAAQKERISFEDPTIKAMAKLELRFILGRPATDEDLTQENLNKITEIGTFAGTSIKTLNDLKNMPNLETVQITVSNAPKVVDTTPLQSLNHLKDFVFWYANSHLSSLKPLAGKPLESLTIKALPTSDHSEKTLNELNHLKEIDMLYFDNEQEISFGNLDNLPNLTKISLVSMGLNTAPSLKSSSKLAYVDFSDNNLSEVPQLPESSALWFVGVSENKIADYTNVDALLSLPSKPSIDLNSNILTTYHEVPSGTRVYLQSNFIIGHGLKWQNAMKTIGTQNLLANEQKEIPIKWTGEDQLPTLEPLTKHQQEFIELKNMTIQTSNDNLTIEKTNAGIRLKAKETEGTTHVTLSYKGDLKTSFDVNVRK